MKKIFSLVLGIIICATAVVGSACANPPSSDVADSLVIYDPRIREFVEDCVLKNEDKFVYDESCANLDDDFNVRNGIYTMTYPDAKQAHADEVNRLLREGKEIKYNSSILSDWAFCELRKRGVECEIMTVGWGRDLFRRVTVLIPQVVNGDREWYVCDLFELAQYRGTDVPGYRNYLLCPIKDYFGLYGEMFRGGIVNDEEYRGYRNGMSIVGGRDVFCWIAQEGHSASFAVDMMSDLNTDSLRLMTGVDHEEHDYWLFDLLKRLSGVELKTDEVILY